MQSDEARIAPTDLKIPGRHGARLWQWVRRWLRLLSLTALIVFGFLLEFLIELPFMVAYYIDRGALRLAKRRGSAKSLTRPRRKRPPSN
jgi:hypothetical protein